MSFNTNGLESVFNLYKNTYRKDADAVAVFVHWYLITNGFRCHGATGKLTEMLPENWQLDENTYIINYSYESKGYELKILMVDEHLMINLGRLNDERVATVTVLTSDHVISVNNDFERVYKNLRDLFDKLQKEFNALIKTAVVATGETRKAKSPERASRQSGVMPNPLRVRPSFDPRGYGRSDLDPYYNDPLAHGGMIFDPLRNNPAFRPIIPMDIPRGSVPPGARFDPFQPPNPDALIPGSSRMEPNPDHLRPPGYDDMFM